MRQCGDVHDDREWVGDQQADESPPALDKRASGVAHDCACPTFAAKRWLDLDELLQVEHAHVTTDDEASCRPPSARLACVRIVN